MLKTAFLTLTLSCCLLCAGCTPDLFGIVMGVKPGGAVTQRLVKIEALLAKIDTRLATLEKP